jgi:hypothetical protein
MSAESIRNFERFKFRYQKLTFSDSRYDNFAKIQKDNHEGKIMANM